MKGCKSCPAFSKCPVTYRGSSCAALRFTYGIEDNPEIKTNADRIRSMNDEELAEHLVDIGWDCSFCEEHLRLDNEPLLRGEKCDEKCAYHCLEWLQQPAK